MASTVTSQIARRVQASGRRYWTTAELREGVDSAQAAHVTIHRLVARGELVRVRRGLYWHPGSVKDGRLRERKVRSAGSAARKVVPDGEALGVSGWQAANLLGLSTQVSPVDVVAVTARVPRPIRGVRFIDRSGRRGRRAQRLTELEVTILEAIEGWDKHVELTDADATARFVELLGRDDVRRDALVRASHTEPAGVRERLRGLLIRGGWEHEAHGIARAVDNRTRAKALRVFANEL